MHKQLAALSVLILAATAVPAWAGWGCGASAGNAHYRGWGYATEAEAREDVLKNCFDAYKHECTLISCQANVDTQQEAMATWPPVAGSPGLFHCTGDAKC